MRGLVVGIAAVVVLSGCGSSRKSSLLLDRPARGPVEASGQIGQGIRADLTPATQTKTDQDVEATVTFASKDFQEEFFKRKDLFGNFAGKSPYFPEQMVFYIKFTNRRTGKIQIKPEDFVVVDDLGNQYSTIGMDYVTAIRESKAPVGTVTRGVMESARPGYFGFSFPVGKVLAAQPQGPFALLKQSTLQSGYLFPGVSHDGMVAFWTPSQKANKVKLYLSHVKTAFDPEDRPTASLDFVFEFEVPAGGDGS